MNGVAYAVQVLDTGDFPCAELTKVETSCMYWDNVCNDKDPMA